MLCWHASLFFVLQCFDDLDIIDTNQIRQSGHTSITATGPMLLSHQYSHRRYKCGLVKAVIPGAYLDEISKVPSC